MLIRRYLKRKRRGFFHPKGVVMMDVDTNKNVRLGYALQHPNDKYFVKSIATTIGLGRIDSGNYSFNLNDPDQIQDVANKIPHSLHDIYFRMCEWLNMPGRVIR